MGAAMNQVLMAGRKRSGAKVVLTRHDNWRADLHKTIEQLRDKPFDWGTHDCAHFAAACIESMTGEDLMQQWHGRYNSKKEAAFMLKQNRFIKTLEGAVKQQLGQPMLPMFAQVGDLLLVRVVTGKALAICTGKTAVAAGPDGVATIPMRDWIQAWVV